MNTAKKKEKERTLEAHRHTLETRGSKNLLAVASVVAKLFEKILDRRLQRWSERVGALSDLQGGFRRGRGTLDQIFILNEVIAMKAEAGAPSFWRSLM